MANKSINTIVEEAERAVLRSLNNNFPTETCAEKKEIAKVRREKVVGELIVRLGGVGPKQVK